MFATLAVILGLALGYYFFIIDWEGRPDCHRQIDGAMQQWMIENKTNVYPNIGGKSHQSLVPITEMVGGSKDWIANYNYVPGIRQDDPGDLVLLYVNRPTRWNWHGKHPTIFEKKAWILVPIESQMSERPGMEVGELSERVSLNEFRSRLKRTLDFVRPNERPYWQAVDVEHTKFQKSVESLTP